MANIKYIVQTKNLSFRFPRQKLLFDGVEMKMPQGSVFGILGQNGAGKSTLLKLLMGLIQPKEGNVSIFEKNPLKESDRSLFAKVGLLLEEPRLYHHLNAWDNLRVMTTYRQLPEDRIPEVLRIVGLEDSKNTLVRNFSTGMKQRLAIGMALLPNPDLLILDEPTNGLDPGGIVAVRDLIRQLNREEKISILMSSHLLGEVEQLCTHLAVLHEGKFLFQGERRDLQEKGLSNKIFHIETDQVDQALKLLRKKNIECRKLEEQWLALQLPGKQAIVEVIDHFRNEQLPVFQVRMEKATLESSFLRLFKEDNR